MIDEKNNLETEDDDFIFESKKNESGNEENNEGSQGVQSVQQNNEGIEGTQGIQGTQGSQSIQSITKGTQGIQGIQSIQETQGVQDSQEVQGIQGTQGVQKKTEIPDIFLSDSLQQMTEKNGEKSKISYKPIASDLGIELENDTPEELKIKISKKIEDAKQEFKLEDYTDDAKILIKHLKENGGKIEDFLNNKNIVSLYSVKNLDPEDKVLFVRTNELTNAGVSIEKAQEQASAEIEEMSTKDILDKSNKINTDADRLINDEIKKITGDRNTKVQLDKEKVLSKIKAEVENIKSYVMKQTDFLGIPISEKAKQGIIRDIETGAFNDIADKTPESSKFVAYMLSKFGKTILDTLNKEKVEQNRKGYAAAVEKGQGALHKTKETARPNSSGHQRSKIVEKTKFDGFTSSLGEDE